MRKARVAGDHGPETEELPARSKVHRRGQTARHRDLKFDRWDQATNAPWYSGQTDAMSTDSPGDAVCDQTEQRGKLEQAGRIFDSAPYGWPVKKASALAAAMHEGAGASHRVATTRYIATNWGVEGA